MVAGEEVLAVAKGRSGAGSDRRPSAFQDQGWAFRTGHGGLIACSAGQQHMTPVAALAIWRLSWWLSSAGLITALTWILDWAVCIEGVRGSNPLSSAQTCRSAP